MSVGEASTILIGIADSKRCRAATPIAMIPRRVTVFSAVSLSLTVALLAVGLLLSTNVYRGAAAAEGKPRLVYVKLGGAKLGIPKEWVLDKNGPLKAGIRGQPKRGNVLQDALTATEPLQVTHISICCGGDALAPIFPYRLPFFIVLSGGISGIPSGVAKRVEEKQNQLRKLKTKEKEIFPRFWKFDRNQYFFVRENSHKYIDNIRYITCPDNNLEPPINDYFYCTAYFAWNEGIGIKYMFKRSQFPLREIGELDDIVVALMIQLEQWAEQGEK